MKSSVALLMVALVACAVVPSQREVWLGARASTVRVDVEEGMGTGVVVSDKCIVTALHVIGDHKEATLTLGDKKLQAKEVAHDTTEDVSLLCAASSLNAPAATLGHEPAIYDPVFKVGNPLGIKDILTQGQYQGDNYMTAQCAPGDSGGGVWDAQGHLIGLVDAILLYNTGSTTLDFPHLCKLVPLSAITNLLTSNNIGYRHERQ